MTASRLALLRLVAERPSSSLEELSEILGWGVGKTKQQIWRAAGIKQVEGDGSQASFGSKGRGPKRWQITQRGLKILDYYRDISLDEVES